MIKGQHSAASSELLLRVHPVGALSGQRSNENNIYWLIVLVKMSEGQATIESNWAMKSKTSFLKGKGSGASNLCSKLVPRRKVEQLEMKWGAGLFAASGACVKGYGVSKK